MLRNENTLTNCGEEGREETREVRRVLSHLHLTQFQGSKGPGTELLAMYRMEASARQAAGTQQILVDFPRMVNDKCC